MRVKKRRKDVPNAKANVFSARQRSARYNETRQGRVRGKPNLLIAGILPSDLPGAPALRQGDVRFSCDDVFLEPYLLFLSLTAKLAEVL